jgi:type I restriction enzyme R subunit
MDDYNALFGTNHVVSEFDLYYQDVQKRIKDHRFSNQDYAHKNKVDIVIVVDMLLTGFDSKYLNTLYVDKNLKYHGLIQAFSRTNRVLNDTKPYGNILDFRSQQNAVDEAIKLFAGKQGEQAKEIWLVEPAPKVIKRLHDAVKDLEGFMKEQSLSCTPDSAHKLKGDEARAEFLNKFKEVQRLKTQLDQYTDLTNEQKEIIDKRVPEEDLRGFRGAYLEIAKRFKDQRGKDDSGGVLEQLDFEFVLFSSAIIDYDYIMKLISEFTQSRSKQKMTRDQLIGLLTANSNFMEQKDDIIAYINTLKVGDGLTEEQIREGFKAFKDQKTKKDIADIAKKHGLDSDVLYGFIENVIDRMIFDGDKLSDLMEPFDLGWKERTRKEEALMGDLIPLFLKLVAGREISGLAAYE